MSNYLKKCPSPFKRLFLDRWTLAWYTSVDKSDSDKGKPFVRMGHKAIGPLEKKGSQLPDEPMNNCDHSLESEWFFYKMEL